MADLYTDLIKPVELTGYAREALRDRPENRPSLSNYLPDEYVDDLTFRFSQGGGALTDVASYRAFDTEAPLSRREGISVVQGQLPPISRKMRLGEYDSLVLRNATDEQRNLLLRDTERLVREVDARLEVARGQALVHGKVTIAENGVAAEVDFGRSAEMSVEPANSWATVGTSNPVDDLLLWQEAYIAKNGVAPERLLTSTKIRSYLQRHPQIKAEVSPNATVQTVSLTDLNGFLQAYGLPPVEVYDVQFNFGAASDNVQRVIPQNKILFLPSGGLGATLWGTTLEAADPDYGITERPGIVASTWRTKDPQGVWSHVAAIALPILGNPDLSMVASVEFPS